MKCAVLCAGAGRRLGANIPKPLVQINDKTILQIILDEWRSCADGFVIVANPEWSEHFEKTLQTFESLPYIVVEQAEPRGIADAILPIESWVADEKFVVVLGDCLYKGEWLVDDSNPAIRGVGYWLQGDSNSTKAGYGVDVEGGNVRALVEKPQDVTNLKCGMGTYFLDHAIFDYILNATPSKLRGEVEITDVIQNMIDDGLTVNALPFDGRYININTKQDLERAKKIWPKNKDKKK